MFLLYFLSVTFIHYCTILILHFLKRNKNFLNYFIISSYLSPSLYNANYTSIENKL